MAFFGIVLVCLLIGIVVLRARSKEGFAQADDLHREFVDRQQKAYNPIGTSLILRDRTGVLGPTTKPLLGTATRIANEDGTDPRTIITDPYPVKLKEDGLAAIIAKCEAVKTTDCSIFDKSDYAKDCGVCLDVGLNSKNEPHTGGLVLLEKDREYAQKYKRGNRVPDYVPTLGQCPTNRLVSTKAECLRVKREMDCQKGANFDLPGCSQCYADGTYFPVDSETTSIPGKFTVAGRGKLTIQEAGMNPVRITLKESGGDTYEMRQGEGTNVSFILGPTDDGASPYLAGLFSGSTPRGAFNNDLRLLVKTDSITGRKPRTLKSTTIQQVPVTTMAPGYNRNTMHLQVVIPFTFIEPDSAEGDMCGDGPYVTKQSSATFLGSDPCYKSGAAPGKFNMECLQGMFLSNGCLESGAAYPKSAITSAKLMVNNDGSFRSLSDIADVVYQNAVAAATGSLDGKKLTLEEWSAASEFCTGRSINSPCDTPTRDTGPLGLDCLRYMWNNEGANKPFGSTYMDSALSTSLQQYSKDNRFCQSSGSLAPYDADGKLNMPAIQYWQRMGGVETVRAAMREIHRLANSDAPDSVKQNAVLQCYGSQLGNRPKMGTIFQGTNRGDWQRKTYKGKPVTGCEGQNAKLTCGSDTIVGGTIRYGRWDNSTCPHGTVSSQTPAREATFDLPSSCFDKTDCEININNGIAGDPYGGVYKHFIVTPDCAENPNPIKADLKDGAPGPMRAPSNTKTLIVWDPGFAFGNYVDVNMINNSMGGNADILGYDKLPADLTKYAYVWDTNFNSNSTLPTKVADAYERYLKAGGALFIHGEHAGGWLSRDQGIAAFIARMGGGDVTAKYSIRSEMVTVHPAFIFDKTLPRTYRVAANGEFDQIGKGKKLFIEDNKGAVIWTSGTLQNAKSGCILVWLDINVVDSAGHSSPPFVKRLADILRNA